jgi:hypothetical protein
MNASSSRHGSDFDAFLFAPIGEDGNGLLLSVVSLLARMDLDPWHEAARLAALPTQASAEELASLLAALPAQVLRLADPGAMATRLIALLPHPTRAQSKTLELPPVAATNHPRLIMQLVLFAIWVAWILSTPIATPAPDASTHANPGGAPPISVPSALPTNSGK